MFMKVPRLTLAAKKIVIREIGDANKHAYRNTDITALGGLYADGIIQVASGQFNITQAVGAQTLGSLDVLGLQTAGGANGLTTTTDWVDEKAPAIKINYNENTQKLEFTVDRTVLGTGTESNFNSFSIFGSTNADSTNNLGVPTQDDASTVLIRGGEVLRTEPFVADGEALTFLTVMLSTKALLLGQPS